MLFLCENAYVSVKLLPKASPQASLMNQCVNRKLGNTLAAVILSY
jgi:hypothetical protein